VQAHETLALGDPTSGTHSMIVGKLGAGPFKDYADADNQQVICRTKMRVYPVLGSPETTIKVPETDPDYLRLTVQEAFEALVRVPDIRLVRCLVLVDDVHREEPWLRQTVAPEWRVFAETFPEEGEIFLYRPVADDDVSTTLKHEWAHLLQFAELKWQQLFDQVGDLERFFTGDATLDAVDGIERWAYFGERLLSTAPLLSPATASANPIRATIWVEALAHRLATLPVAMKADENAFYEYVVKWTRDTARPVALRKLHAAAAEHDRADRARSILKILGGE